MRRFVFDTNITLAYIREHELYQKVEQDLQLTSEDTNVLLPVTTKAELLSLGKQRGWGDKKFQRMNAIDLYARRKNGHIILSDDGQTLRDLALAGLEISRSQKRKEIFNRILLNYGVKLNDNNEFTVECDDRNFPQRKHNLLSAIIEANDMYALAKHTVAGIFREDVRAYLDELEIVYTPFFISRGSSRLEFTFDFQIAYPKKEIVIKAFNVINKMHLSHFLFPWSDIKDIREKQTGKELTGLAIINDEKEVHEDYLHALREKGADYILFSQRNAAENIQKLKPVA